MNRAALETCWPWMTLLVAAVAAAAVVARLSRGRPNFGRLAKLHSDEVGSVQSLSFVLTLPLFVMILLFIVQVSQLMIGAVVVHYAAYAAARSASVWVGANAGPAELENCLGSCSLDPDAKDQQFPVVDPNDDRYGPGEGGLTYVVAVGGPKCSKILAAAAMACMPIAPSRGLGFDLSTIGDALPADVDVGVMESVYQAMVPQSQSSSATGRRLKNKLAYVLNNTKVEIRFFHKNEEPPLGTYLLEDEIAEFRPNELGWQDPITVTVKHDLALLPGPGRLLARHVLNPNGAADRVAETTEKKDGYYIYPLQASATIGNEGEKSVIPYVYEIH